MLSSTQQQYGGQSVVTRILLVDDDLHLVPLIQRGLAYEGFEVYTAMDGESGLAAVRQHRPHIVLLDIAMPGPDGFEVCRRLRATERGKSVPILMCTVRSALSTVAAGFEAGATGYVLKPFEMEELLESVADALKKARPSA